VTEYDMTECPHGLTIATCSLCRPQPTKPSAAKRPTTSPRSAADPIEPLHGTKDLSMHVHQLEPYFGARTDWLAASHGYPQDLRPGGWVYLRCDGKYAARVRVVGLEWREQRPFRTGDVGSGEGFGPGLVLLVDKGTWAEFGQHLGDDADNVRQGYRYHRRRGGGGELVRFSKGDRVRDEDWED
jgi:hypothetical protein